MYAEPWCSMRRQHELATVGHPSMPDRSRCNLPSVPQTWMRMRLGTRRRRGDEKRIASTTRTIPRRTTERTRRTRGRESWSGTLICERHRSTCTPNLRFQRTIRIPRGERARRIIAKPSSGIPITRRRRRAGRVERAGACYSLSDGFVRDRRRMM